MFSLEYISNQELYIHSRWMQANDFVLKIGNTALSNFVFANNESKIKAGNLMNPLWRSLNFTYTNLKKVLRYV